MVMKMHVMARIDPSSGRCRGDAPAGLQPTEVSGRDAAPGRALVTLAFMAGPFMRLPVSRRRGRGRCARWKSHVKVFSPGMPGTDTSARLVTQVTVTDTQPPATKFDVSTVICGAVQVRPAPARDACAAEVRLGLGVGGIGLDDRGLDPGARRGLDVSLGRVDPAEGDHEDDDDQEDRGDDHQLGDGRPLFSSRPAAPMSDWSASHSVGTPGWGRRSWRKR